MGVGHQQHFHNVHNPIHKGFHNPLRAPLRNRIVWTSCPGPGWLWDIDSINSSTYYRLVTNYSVLREEGE